MENVMAVAAPYLLLEQRLPWSTSRPAPPRSWTSTLPSTDSAPHRARPKSLEVVDSSESALASPTTTRRHDSHSTPPLSPSPHPSSSSSSSSAREFSDEEISDYDSAPELGIARAVPLTHAFSYAGQRQPQPPPPPPQQHQRRTRRDSAVRFLKTALRAPIRCLRESRESSEKKGAVEEGLGAPVFPASSPAPYATTIATSSRWWRENKEEGRQRKRLQKKRPEGKKKPREDMRPGEMREVWW
ncbi:hypothetical protein BS50DRAFT_628948 [Corynespora cassiicola Philippines]|uniref:Uncharacterized protein n=1 Tax=Corynespora cassiicola Philippines TaxID=1448308 RepID=A0A2T2P572_CORCC|nr:hypothetical protein BS50DRAFT_628948 [Corynespora cassiicola Philippines]